MSKLKKFSIKNLQKSLIKTVTRFPLAVLISGAVFVLLVTLIKFDDLSQHAEDVIGKSIVTLMVTFFFSVGVYLFSESRNASKIKQWSCQLFSVIFGGGFYLFLKQDIFERSVPETFVYVWVTFFGVLAFMFISSFVISIAQKKYSQKEFYIFSYQLVLSVIMAMVVGIVSMLLGFLAIWAIFELFDLKFLEEGNFFGYWASFTHSFFAPIFFLANIPLAKTDNMKQIQGNKFYGFLIKYVGLPTIVIYFTILYAYTIKVLSNFSEWPQGKITWMVIGFSVFGYLIYFATYVFREKFPPARFFRKIFPIAVLPQLVMLFYAIFLRINQYDFTINRYLVVVFGIWLLGISSYYAFSRKKSLSAIFCSLLLMTVLISVGPWSIYTFPENRQQSKLVKNLREANILQDEKIILLGNYDDISAELSGEIYNSIDYLCDFHGCEVLDSILEKEIIEIKNEDEWEFEKKKKESIERANGMVDAEAKKHELERIEKRRYREMSNRSLKRGLAELIKVQEYGRYGNRNRISKFLNFRSKDYSRRYKKAAEVSGYDYYLTEIVTGCHIADLSELEGVKYIISVDVNEGKLIVYNQKSVKRNDLEIVEIFDLKEIFEQILAKKEIAEEGEYRLGYYLNEADLIFELEGEKLDVKIHFDRIDIPNPEWTEDVQKDQQAARANGSQYLEIEEANRKFRTMITDIENGDADGRIWLKEKFRKTESSK